MKRIDAFTILILTFYLPTMQAAPAPRRSTSRSKRPHPALSDLRLAPLSQQFADEQRALQSTASTSIFSPLPNPNIHVAYSANHSSYIQGRSAPTTPGILSRSSSRRTLHGGGLSRKSEIYEQEDGDDKIEDTAAQPEPSTAPSFTYAAIQVSADGRLRDSARRYYELDGIPKAKSEAALHAATQGPKSKHYSPISARHAGLSLQTHCLDAAKRSTGPHSAQLLTPASRSRRQAEREDWLTRAGIATNSLLRESKGQSWLASRDSATSLLDLDAAEEEEHEDKENRLSSSGLLTSRSAVFADDEMSPFATRAGSRWGSRFGSRVGSAKNSRRGSRVALRTPLSTLEGQSYGQGSGQGYFDQVAGGPIKPDFVDAEDEEEVYGEVDEEEIAKLARGQRVGLGGIVDRLVGLTMFRVDEDREGSEDEEDDREQKTQGRKEDAAWRAQIRQAGVQRVDDGGNDVGGPKVSQTKDTEGGWKDAAWLLSVASKVLL